jgi:hypothetical protein
MDRYNRTKIKFLSLMIDAIGWTSKIFNQWIDTFTLKACSRLRIFTLLLPIVAGVALDVLGNRKVQLFRHTNTGGFLLCP